MAPIGRLTIAIPRQTQALAALAVAALTSTELLPTSDDYQHFATNVKPEWTAKFTFGKVPAFESIDGLVLTEGIAIARYFAARAGRTDLLGKTIVDAALVDMWTSFAYTELWPLLMRHTLVSNSYVPYPGQDTVDGINQHADRALEALNRHLILQKDKSEQFIATAYLTVVDLTVVAMLRAGFGNFIDAQRRKRWPELKVYTERVLEDPILADVYGVIEYCEEASSYVPKV
ncbi:hypothetical protein BKA62DRAFT_760435 [Auriculariales sp. MPI-PUGE-AT-0066]|nr:hypothetical protein BKA62DRAFT_760435 [Auriculariales sp. MPI-PUGE-AT-0066]